MPMTPWKRRGTTRAWSWLMLIPCCRWGYSGIAGSKLVIGMQLKGYYLVLGAGQSFGRTSVDQHTDLW
jgi:hypothetical protein